MKNSFVMYTKYKKQIDTLTVEQKAALLDAVMAYQTDEEVPELDPMTEMLFSVMQNDFDEDREKYEEKCAKRSESGKAGGRPRKEEKQMLFEKAKKANAFLKSNEKQKKQMNPDSDNDCDSDSDCDYEGDMKEKNVPLGTPKEKSSRFSPPTPAQVQEYVDEKGYSVDSERFCDFYASKGWMIGKNKMKDWKSAVRNWARDRKKETPPNTSHPMQRIDYDTFEKELFG